jgi:hypothetical protein
MVEVKRPSSTYCRLQARHDVEAEEGVEKNRSPYAALEKVTWKALVRLVSFAKALLMEDCVGCKIVPRALEEVQVSLLVESILEYARLAWELSYSLGTVFLLWPSLSSSAGSQYYSFPPPSAYPAKD